MLRRHRLIETYLVANLGYTWDTVHDEAERLEHAVSDELVERIADALGDPRVDPHGDPIPDADGEITEFIHVPLTDVAVGESAVVRRGASVAVLDRQPFEGPIALRVNAGTERIVAHDLAALLLCSKGS